MNDMIATLTQLIEQLHEVNAQLSRVALRLEHVSRLSEQQKKQLRDELKAGLERWEEISRQIGQALSVMRAAA